MSRKFTTGEVSEEFSKEGFTLLTKEYINSNQKLMYICPNGHEHQTTRVNWLVGSRCPYCSGKKQKDIKNIEDEFNNEEYILLTKEYKNAFQKLYFICPNGHEHFICWNNWQQGHRCGICKRHVYTEEELIELKNYTNLIRSLTEKNYREYFNIINPEEINRDNKFHLDHIFSIIDGFNNNVLPKIISSPANLRIVAAIENLSKQRKSDITLEELYSRYYKFIEVQ